MKSLILIILLCGVHSTAMELADAPKDKTVTQEVQKIRTLLKCLKSSGNSSGIRACGKPLYNSKIDQKTQDKMSFWFMGPYKLKKPRVCSKMELRFIPKEILKKSSKVICADYSKNSLDMTARFYFKDGQLVNIHRGTLKE